jgi:hypothetical protein
MAILIIILLVIAFFLWPSNRKQVLIAFDQLINARFGGYADETFSARCWRSRHIPKYQIFIRIIDALFFWQDAHCRKAYESEVNRNHLPPYYKGNLR